MHDPKVRTFDGSDNNRDNPTWGAADTRLRRRTGFAYADGVSSLAVRAGANTNPRHLSNVLCSQKQPTPNPLNLSDYVWAWGQFLDHELDLTEPEPTEEADIEVAAGDPVLDGGGRVPFTRSIFDEHSGTDASNPREQINQISAYVDASNVYGSDDVRATALRRLDGSGKLKTTASPHGDLLPFNLAGLQNAGGTRNDFFVAGDIRANEHVVLLSLHTLFVREHNRLCDQILADDPELFGDDEAVYQEARRIVSGIMQAITYNEFLPALLGEGAIAPENGYREDVDASVDNLFSTACYRLGHSMLSPSVRIGREGRLTLREMFFRPKWIEHNGIDGVLDGLWRQTMQEIDTRAVDDIRSFLFDPPDHEGGVIRDLAALNIQRGRDHGLPGYNACRRAFRLDGCGDFGDVTSDSDLAERLAQVYESVDDIDPWIGGLAEDHTEGSAVGPFLRAVIADQFERARDGDRFWYERDPELSHEQKKMIGDTSLADVIERNTDLCGVPEDVFHCTSDVITPKEPRRRPNYAHPGRKKSPGRKRRPQHRPYR